MLFLFGRSELAIIDSIFYFQFLIHFGSNLLCFERIRNAKCVYRSASQHTHTHTHVTRAYINIIIFLDWHQHWIKSTCAIWIRKTTAAIMWNFDGVAIESPFRIDGAHFLPWIYAWPVCFCLKFPEKGLTFYCKEEKRASRHQRNDSHCSSIGINDNNDVIEQYMKYVCSML